MSALLARRVQQGIEILGPDAPEALLADAALRYGSTEAHNARVQNLACEIVESAIAERMRVDPATAERAADAGDSIDEYVCFVLYGHDFPSGLEERERCLCSLCGKDGDA